MVINTESKIGYNNELRRASPHMRLDVNHNVNAVIKQIRIPKHNFVPSKNNLPHEIEIKKNMTRNKSMLSRITQKLLVQ